MVAGQETRHRKSEAPPGHGTGTMAFPLSEHTPLVQWEVEKVLWEVVREVVWEVVWEMCGRWCRKCYWRWCRRWCMR